ncbi:hypothetical protein [Rufibacter quisquiliarum]|nr:hypothetical protein [Rufibacter quisquiliarum]
MEPREELLALAERYRKSKTRRLAAIFTDTPSPFKGAVAESLGVDRSAAYKYPHQIRKRELEQQELRQKIASLRRPNLAA